MRYDARVAVEEALKEKGLFKDKYPKPYVRGRGRGRVTRASQGGEGEAFLTRSFPSFLPSPSHHLTTSPLPLTISQNEARVLLTKW